MKNLSQEYLFFEQFNSEKTYEFAEHIYEKYVFDGDNESGLDEFYYISRKLLSFYKRIAQANGSFLAGFKADKENDEDISVSLWQAWVLYSATNIRESIFTLQIENDDINARVKSIASRELKGMGRLFDMDWVKIIPRLENAYQVELASVSPMDIVFFVDPKSQAAKLLSALKNQDLSSFLVYFKSFSYGELSHFLAFDYRKNKGLCGVDPGGEVHFSDIYGLESQKARMIANIEVFLRGKIASNMLLYGNSGTGKSTSVKAILGDFHARGLRLISLEKEDINELPDIISGVRAKPYKFLVFIDDLSFEEAETDYKAFKSVLEGRLVSLPQNMLICVTSNRLNIIKETWSEREGDDVHRNDNVQEKRSLSERFGLQITFPPPTKAEYLAIVEGLLGVAGLSLSEELIAAALKHERWAGGRSGRIARQFVDKVIGEQGE